MTITLLFAGCSKKFSYRNAYKFDKHIYAVRADDKVTGQRTMRNDDAQVTASTAPLLSVEPTATVRTKVKQQQLAAAVAALRAATLSHPADTATKPGKPKAEPMPSRNGFAVAGLIVSLIGLPLLAGAPYVLGAGLVLSIFGLKSEKRKLALITIWGTLICLLGILIYFVIAFEGFAY